MVVQVAAAGARRIAYKVSVNMALAGGNPFQARRPMVVFLPGFQSSGMSGRKVDFLQEWVRRTNRASGLLCFDYSGHGASCSHQGSFEKESCVSAWLEDTRSVLETATRQYPRETQNLVFVGSSMGFWIGALLAKELGSRLKGMIGVGAAPDFTDLLWQSFDKEQKDKINQQGHICIPTTYGGVNASTYTITKKLIQDGHKHSILFDGTNSFELEFPVRLLHGSDDKDIDVTHVLRLLNALDCKDLRLTIVKDKDHRFSDDKCLLHIEDTLEELIGLLG